MWTDDTNQWNGLKLRNPPGANLCYLNTALNCLGVNSKLKGMFTNECSGLEDGSKRKILDEVKNLFLLNGQVGDTSRLREFLHEKFDRFEKGEQNDAANALLSLLECVPSAENYCRLGLTVIRTCEECGLETPIIDRDQWGILLGDGSVEEKTLQAAVDEWVSRVSTIERNCVCKSSTSGELLAGPQNLQQIIGRHWKYHKRLIFYMSR